jgi:hypothetical protein
MRRALVYILNVLVLFLTACSASSETGPTKTVTPTEVLTRLEVLPTTTLAPTPTRLVAKTPIPWQTMTSVPTMTELPSLTPMPTSSSTRVPTGIKIEKQKDNSTLVTDYDNKFKFTVPSGWALGQLGNNTPQETLGKLGKTIPNINRTSTFLGALSPNIRILGLNTSLTTTSLGYPVLLRVATLTDPGKAQMQLDIAAKSVRGGLEKAGYKVTALTAKTYANGIKTVVLDVSEEFQVRQNDQFVMLTVVGRVVIFQTAGKLVIISGAAPKAVSESLLGTVDGVVGSIALIK